MSYESDPQGAGIHRLKRRAPEERKNVEKIPGREARRRKRAFDTEMLFSFKNKYHYTYPNTYIALYSRTPKLPVTHTHTHKQETVVHPS